MFFNSICSLISMLRSGKNCFENCNISRLQGAFPPDPNQGAYGGPLDPQPFVLPSEPRSFPCLHNKTKPVLSPFMHSILLYIEMPFTCHVFFPELLYLGFIIHLGFYHPSLRFLCPSPPYSLSLGLNLASRICLCDCRTLVAKPRRLSSPEG